MTQVPKWLSETAKDYWRSLHPQVKPSKKHVHNFALLCQCYADYRQAHDAGDISTKKAMLDQITRWSKEFGLTPKSDKSQVEQIDTLDDLLG